MATVPVIFTGVFYPKGKAAGDKPQPGTFIGNAAIAGLEVGGGPVIPPDELPPGGEGDGPVHIWGGGNEPFPTPPIMWPGFPDSPPDWVKPPEGFPEPPTGVKPFPPGGGWGYSDRTGWVLKPPPGTPGPKAQGQKPR